MERQEGGAGTSGSCQGMGRSPIVLAERQSRRKVAARNVRMPAGMRTSWQGGRERKMRRKALVPEGKHGAARGRCRNLRFLLSAAEERNQ